MKQSQNIGILLSNTINKDALVNRLFSGENRDVLARFNAKKGVLFSDPAIDRIIAEENRYDKTVVTQRKLITHSSGERKKEFLKYCLTKNPDYLVLDNPLDHLDIKSRADLIVFLKKIAEEKILIQLANRISDFLPFITEKYTVLGDLLELQPFTEVSLNGDFSAEIVNIPAPFQKVAVQEELIKLENISVSYDGRQILNGISWTIKQGDFWQLIGPNGSGKSTILGLITGENTKGYGQELYLFGKKKGSGESLWDIKKKIGYFAPSMIQLFERGNTLKEMVLSGFYDSVGLYDKPTTLQKKQADLWLALANMLPLAKTNYMRLSPGQQRLVLILRAMVKNPPLLILDEPTEGLDDASAKLVVKLVHTLRKKTSAAIVFVSHRTESGLDPEAILQLIPSKTGSTAQIIR